MIIKTLSCVLILMFLVAALPSQAAANPWGELGWEVLRRAGEWVNPSRGQEGIRRVAQNNPIIEDRKEGF